MAINVSQCEDGVIYWAAGPELTVSDLYAAQAQTCCLLARYPQRRSLLINATGVDRYPRANLVPPFQRLLRDTDLDLLVYVHSRQDSTLIELVVNLACRLTPVLSVRQIHFAQTLFEAHCLLRSNSVPTSA